MTYSEELSNWTNIQNVTVTDNQIISPNGTLNASKINETVNNSVHRLFLNPTVAAAKHSYSVFAKKGTRSWIYLRLDGASTEQRTWFDVENGVIGTVNSDHNASIEDYGNGWYRCTISIKGTTYDTTPLAILAITKGNDAQDYIGDVNEYIYAWGAQLEANSFSTSYIPTNGSTVQRSAETCNGSGNSEVFNDSEGVLFADISFNLEDNYPNLSIFNNTNATKTDNKIVIYKGAPNSNQISVALRSGGSEYANITANVNVENYNKIVISYKLNEVKYYLNGFLIGTDNTVTVPIGLDTLNFDNGAGANDVYGKTKEIGYYDTALTDEELEYMTSYRSLNEMVTELNLNAL